MTENDSVDIGLQLKSQRERLGYSLLDIAQNTRIRKTYLESIENNQFSDLPGRAYVTGFVKAYARYLGMDSATLLAQLEETRSHDVIPPPLKPISSAIHQPKSPGKPLSAVGWRVLVVVSLIAVVAGAAIYFLAVSQGDKSGETTANVIAPTGEQGNETGDASPGIADETTNMSGDSVTLPKGEDQLPTVLSEPDARKPLPLIPAGGASLRMLALSEGSLIIYIDGLESRPYTLHNGLDLTWQVKETVKVELAEPGLAQFWLGEELLDVDEMDSFQLRSTSGD